MDVMLVIQKNEPTINANTNEREPNWITVATVGSERMVKGGREDFEADQQVATNKETHLIRYSSEVEGIDATHRIFQKDTTDYLYVTVVEKQKRERWIRIEAERKDGQG